jgi:hypothetical protein
VRAKLSTTEKLELIRALFARQHLGVDGRVAVAKAYEGAPSGMVDTAVHHLYVDGCSAAMEFLVDAELCLREPGRRPDIAVATELLDHVYNWQQFEAILPTGRADVLEMVAELKQLVADGDLDAIRATVEDLSDALEGNKTPPGLA